jgi:bacillolysin
MKRLFFVSLLSFCALPAIAQVTSSRIHGTDPRPLHGLDPAKLPALENFDQISKRAVPGGALRGAHYAGKAEIQHLSIEANGTVPSTSTSNVGSSLWRILRSPNGTVNWMWRMGDASSRPNQPTTQAITSVPKMLDELNSILRIEQPSKEFVLQRHEVDQLGLHHYHYNQVIAGVPVWKRDIAVHVDGHGQIQSLNGTYEPTLRAETVPTIESSVAINVAIEHLKSLGQWAGDDPTALSRLGITQKAASLALYPENGRLRLIYDVDVHPNILQHYSYLVDAKTGAIIRRITLHCALAAENAVVHVSPVTKFESVPNVTAKGFHPLSGFANATGTDLNGVSQNFRTYQHTDNTYYMLWDLPNFDAGKSTLPNDMKGGGMTVDLRNKDFARDAEIFHVNSSNNVWADKSAISAHTNMNTCYNYYRTTFNRNAIDGADGTIVSLIHVTESNQGMENAYWNGAMMLYGDGLHEFKPLAGGLDVAAHEMTHGVTGHSADLVYEGQSGALNESFSDVFGVLVDTRNYLIGEDVMQPGQGIALRNMENPEDPNAGSQQPGTMAEFKNLGSDQDNGGVHTNSGIPNHAAVLVMKALGREKTQRIYYLALTKYLTRNSQFIDCRLGCEAAADELFGKGSNETKAVSDAFAAVGIGGTSSGGGGNDVPTQTGGTDYIVFMVGDGNIGVLQTSTQQASLFSDPAAVARVSTTSAGVDRCQLSAPRTGKDIWFVSSSGLLSLIESATGSVFNFPSLMIQQSGDVWNASVSPDESYVALASSYTNDPNIYIYDGSKLSRIELLPETQDGGAQATIDYPDVMNWSPNKSQPRIAFDAFQEASISGSTLSYWSMYEINFQTGKIFNLVPAQPEDISIGNVTYSKTNPDLIAFNMLDATSSDVVVASFENNAMVALDMPNHTINGQNILDADRPTFSPNDRSLAFTSAANDAILFFDGATNQLTFTALAQPIYNPYWMLVGGSASVDRTVPNHTFTEPDISENILDGSASVTFALSAAVSTVSVDIVNVMGDIVLHTSSGALSAGDQSVTLNLRGVAAGAYLVRVSDGVHSAFGKFVHK